MLQRCQRTGRSSENAGKSCFGVKILVRFLDGALLDYKSLRLSPFVFLTCFVPVPPRNLRIESQKDTAVEGEEIELNCTSMASRPATMIKWFKGSKELFGRSTPSSTHLLNGVDLEVPWEDER